MLQDLAEPSNNLFRNIRVNREITEKELKYFTIDFKKTTNLGKLYLLPEIHNCLFEVSVRPNCTPTENVSDFLDSQFKSVIQEGWLYIKDSGDFIKKLKNIDYIPQNAVMVTADFVGLYPSIPHAAGLEALREALSRE